MKGDEMLVLGAEAGAEVVLGLGAGVVDAIDDGREGSWALDWVGRCAHFGAGWEVVLGILLVWVRKSVRRPTRHGGRADGSGWCHAGAYGTSRR
jgi:hypothetical protein